MKTHLRAALLILVGMTAAYLVLPPDVQAQLRPGRFSTLVITGLETITKAALGVTSTDGQLIQNSTAATVGTTAQISPRTRWCGQAWNSVGAVSEINCFFVEDLSATAAGTTSATFKIGYIAPNGTVTYPFTMTSSGVVNTLSTFAAGGNVFAGAGNNIGWTGRSLVTSSADGKAELMNNVGTAGVGFDVTTDGLGIVRNRAQNADADWRAASFQGIQKILLKSSGTTASQVATAQTTVPTCTTNCGSPGNVVVGTDTAGIITMGTTPASAFVVVFNGTWAAIPSCLVQSSLASMVVGKMPIAVVATTGQFTVTTNGTAPVAGDKYSYHCLGVQ